MVSDTESLRRLLQAVESESPHSAGNLTSITMATGSVMALEESNVELS